MMYLNCEHKVSSEMEQSALSNLIINLGEVIDEYEEFMKLLLLFLLLLLYLKFPIRKNLEL
jgi:hypothetical protein